MKMVPHSVSSDVERVTIGELGKNTKATVDRVEAGTDLLITRNGVPVARMVPVSPGEARLGTMAAAGEVNRDWRAARAGREQFLARIRVRRGSVDENNAASAALQQMRDDERY